jgi:hypothetical protein
LIYSCSSGFFHADFWGKITQIYIVWIPTFLAVSKENKAFGSSKRAVDRGLLAVDLLFFE